MNRMMRPFRLLSLWSAISGTALALSGCGVPAAPALSFPDVADVPFSTVSVGAGLSVCLGGYGSSMAYRAQDSTFWLQTDRGPNVDGPVPDSKVFLLPSFTPRVGVFKLRGDSLRLERQILLADSAGHPFCGLPDIAGPGATGETAYDRDLRPIGPTRQPGIDPEGLALLPDGTFWVSDEYGPYLLHFDRDGRCLEKLAPGRGLPASYAHRRPNRGMEGLCASADGNTLYGIMQSPLAVPGHSPLSACLPLMALRSAEGNLRQYAYPLDNAANGVSELAYAGHDTLLVLERDGAFPESGKGFKRVYRVTLTHADPSRPLRKELLVDLLKAIPDYDHDKPEGLTLIGDSILAVANDDDFGVTSERGGVAVAKLKRDGQPDRNRIYFVRLHKRAPHVR